MKKRMLLVLLIMSFFYISCKKSIDAKAPKAVKKTFQKMYPGENDPDWHKDDNGNYESHFKIKGVKYRGDFKPTGEWIETESSIDVEDLPKAIKNAIERDHGGSKITEVEKVQHHSKGLFYDVEFKQKGKNRDVEYNALGIIIN